MTESKYEIVAEKLFDFTAGVHCGVLVPEHVMRKLAKLQTAHLEAVKRVLMENKDELYPSMWTLHYPEGKQTTVRFADLSPWRSIEDSIKSAVVSAAPVHCPLVFKAKSMEEAAAMADAHHEATHVTI